MKSLTEQLVTYKQQHTNQFNRIMNYISIPAIVFSLLILLNWISIDIATKWQISFTWIFLIATLISQFLLPIHARTHLRRTQALTLSQLRDLYIAAMITPHSDEQIFNYIDLDETIVKSLTKQRQLAKESSNEPKGSAFDPDNFMQSFYCEKEMLRSINFMYNAMTHTKNIQHAFFQSEPEKILDKITKANQKFRKN